MSTESEKLAAEADKAKAAIGRTLRTLGQEVGHSADPRAWVKAHPWATLAVALVGGFAAADVLIPSAEEQALKHLAELQAALHPKDKPADSPNGNGHTDAPPPPSEKPHHKLLGTLAYALLQAGRPLLMTLIAPLTSPPPPPPEPQNGHDAPAEPS